MGLGCFGSQLRRYGFRAARPTGVRSGGREGTGSRVNKRPYRFGTASGDAAKGLSLAMEFAGAVFLFWFLGRLVDNWLGTEPWAQLIGSLIGWAGGFLHVYYATRETKKS